MDPQININTRRERPRCCCIDLILGIFIILLSFAVGLIIGGLTGFVDFLGIGALVVLSIVLVLLIVIRAIMILCREGNRRCCS